MNNIIGYFEETVCGYLTIADKRSLIAIACDLQRNVTFVMHNVDVNNQDPIKMNNATIVNPFVFWAN